MRLRWIASHSSVYPKDEARAYSAAFVVDGRKAVEKFIEFQHDDPPNLLQHGPYKATIEAIIEPQRWLAGRKWRRVASYTFNTQLATEGRTNLIPRTNDPDLWGRGDKVWK